MKYTAKIKYSLLGLGLLLSRGVYAMEADSQRVHDSPPGSSPSSPRAAASDNEEVPPPLMPVPPRQSTQRPIQGFSQQMEADILDIQTGIRDFELNLELITRGRLKEIFGESFGYEEINAAQFQIRIELRQNILTPLESIIDDFGRESGVRSDDFREGSKNLDEILDSFRLKLPYIYGTLADPEGDFVKTWHETYALILAELQKLIDEGEAERVKNQAAASGPALRVKSPVEDVAGGIAELGTEISVLLTNLSEEYEDYIADIEAHQKKQSSSAQAIQTNNKASNIIQINPNIHMIGLHIQTTVNTKTPDIAQLNMRLGQILIGTVKVINLIKADIEENIGSNSSMPLRMPDSADLSHSTIIALTLVNLEVKMNEIFEKLEYLTEDRVPWYLDLINAVMQNTIKCFQDIMHNPATTSAVLEIHEKSLSEFRECF